jgi:CDP-6-deoxy-D-xylo-4-hexulose-3-dehydrase
MGEGGCVATSNPLLKKIINSLRDWGRDCVCETGKDNFCGRRFSQQHGRLPFGYDHKYVYSHIGYNLKITDLQAAIGCSQLKKLAGFVRLRQKNFYYLKKYFKKYGQLFGTAENETASQPAWFGFPLIVKKNPIFNRDKIVAYLEKHKIATRMLFAGNLTKQPAYAKSQYRIAGNLKNTDLIMNDLFWIGVYPGIKPKMLRYITTVLDSFLCQKN